jgi:DNA mismatch repair protein MutL
MARIRILPDRVANQIAAGEVVERPAAVVKELVENALDAGAGRIEVEFSHGGRSLIRVDDDGRGMGRDDARLAFERHATSKIAEAADLDRLSTFGFRGEALPSIASVSRCTLQTREAGGDAGTEILIDGGKLVHVRDCGRPVGTRVRVEHLFHPVPARRKFLKSDRTEAAHITQCVRLYALACPAVAFALIEDGREVFRSPACPGLAERAAEIFGSQWAGALMPIEASGAGLRLRGLIGRPEASRATRHETISFVNFRPVDSRALTYALVEGYGDWLAKGRFPPAILFLECDPAAVDVNVHPAKREVRFRSEADVRAFVVGSVHRRLREVPAPAGAAAEPVFAVSESPAPRPPPAAIAPEAGPAPSRVARSPEPSDEAGPAWRFLGIAHGATAVFETQAGIVLLDLKAALERVWWDRLESRAGSAPSQKLLLPPTLELDPIASSFLVDQRASLALHGFGIADFGRHSFRLEAIPAWMEPEDAEPFLRDLLGALREGARERDPARERLARLAAARSARLPGSASEAEIRALVAELFRTRSPLVSPGGRPTCLEIGHAELARRFNK